MTHRALYRRLWPAAALLLAACHSDSLTDGGDGSPKPSPTVAFTAHTGADATRGVPVDSLAGLKDFRADAWLHRGGATTLFFEKERQYEPSADGVFHADKAYLWPGNPGDLMTFVALAPWETAQNLDISRQGNFTYTVPADAASQPDLMFAKADDEECPAVGGGLREPVPLHFRHLLTQVRFVFGANLANYWRRLTVHSVTVENAAATGTWDAAAGEWRDTDQPTHSFTITASPDSTGPGNGVRSNDTSEKNIWSKEYTMFLMPQTLPANARVTVDMSYKASASEYDTEVLERKVYSISLDGKQLLPGHTVIVEINSNYTADCLVASEDGTPIEEIRPLPARATDLTLRLLRSGGGDALTVTVAPESRAFTTISSGDSSVPGHTCSASTSLTIHITANASPNDRFIRLILSPVHDVYGRQDHIVVIKQRGKATYGTFDDVLDYEDRLMPWGFNWQPLTVRINYDFPPIAAHDYDMFVRPYVESWTQTGNGCILYDFTALRDHVRVANSPSDGLTNTKRINAECYFLNPLSAVDYLLISSAFFESSLSVNGVEMDYDEFSNTYSSQVQSAVMEAVGQNLHSVFGGYSGPFVKDNNLKCYLPAIAQLETIAADSETPLVRGRTYWSSTVDADGEPIALTISADGSLTRTKPGAGTQAWVHPVRTLE